MIPARDRTLKATNIRIKNFRGIKDLTLDLDEMTVLIGENNSGKTSVLDAFRLCLRELGPRRRSVFGAFDFHLADAAVEPATAAPIQIQITFAEQSRDEWDKKLVRRLNRQRIVQVDDDDCNHVILRVICEYDLASPDFVANWAFLNLEGEALTAVSDRALADLQREVTYFYLQALRDASHHFGERGRFWRPFLKDTQLPPEKKAEIEETIRQVNDLVVSSHNSFDRVHQGLRRIQDVVPLSSGDIVSIEAVPGRIFDMLANAQVNLGALGGAKIPVGRHGEGTQSLAVLMLFAAFLDAWPNGVPIVALEEPEAHLHPSAVRALQRLVRNLTGQKLISTHSGDLLAETDVHQIRRLARTSEGIRSYRIAPNLLNQKERRQFDYHIRQTRGELLFARCWLLVEGETESWVFSAAARALGIDLHRCGVRIVAYRSSDISLFAKVANALGILWYCVADDDDEGRKTREKVERHLHSADEKDRIVLPYDNIEVHLLSNGYECIYSALMPEQKMAEVRNTKRDSNYWNAYAKIFGKGKKTEAAAAVAIEMEERGANGVSMEICAVLEKVKSLIGNA